MSDASTAQMIAAYMEEATVPGFLTSQATRNSFHNSEDVEIDIERDDDDVAVVVSDMTTGGRRNEYSLYTNKRFTPPVYKEEAALNGFDAIKRQAGENPFADVNYQAHMNAAAFKVFRRLERKIRRAVELQWAQVLQTGKLTLTDDGGTTLYELDFGLKSTHEVTVGATWSGGAGTPLSDIADLAEVVRQDGKRSPDQLIFGKTAWDDFIQNTRVKDSLDNRRMEFGVIRPQAAPDAGAAYNGRLTIGTYTFDLWVYDIQYKDPVTGNHLPYVTDDKVIMKSAQSRLDMSWGNVPMAVSPEQRVAPFLPGRMSDRGAMLDLVTNAYAAKDNTGVVIGAYARPLTIPTAIDTIACLDTRP